MKRVFIHIISFAILSACFSCTSLLPVNNHYEKAGTLKRGNLEGGGHYTAYRVSHYGRNEATNQNYGFRFGVGATDRVDIKFRYERLKFTKNFGEGMKEANYFSFVPKLAVVPDQFSFLLPLSFYDTKTKFSTGVSTDRITSIAPQFIYTYTNRKKTTDVSCSVKMDFITGQANGDGNLFYGFTLGSGFSTNLNKWAIRPEVGITSDGSRETFWSYGIGFQYVLLRKK